MASPRLFVHIGLQKTGTSYLQRILWDSQAEVARQGIDLVPDSKLSMFHLMLDVRQRYSPKSDPPEVARALASLPGQLRSAQDTALISQESLSTATDEQIARFLEHTAGREVHVIVTLRDPGRQIPSAWQQTLQSGKSRPMADYLRRLESTWQKDGAKVWATMDAPGILARWAAHVPAEQIHVITVPPAGSPQDQLLHRFCDVVGLDPSNLTIDTTTRQNRSLRAEQAEVLRRVNELLPAEFKRRDVYGALGKRYFAVQILGSDQGTKIQMPASRLPWCLEVADHVIDSVERGGYAVIGDLADLRPAASSFAVDDSPLPADDVTQVAAQALADMLVDRMNGRERRAQSAAANGRSSGAGRVRAALSRRLRG